MRLTSKGRYAVRAMLDLTTHSSGNPVRLQEISKRQSISLHYLEQLFRRLRTGSVVKSVRGPGGGYVLARSMDEISVRDVLASVGENINPAKDILGVPSSGVDAKNAEGEDIIVDTSEFHSTKTYFENLGVLMQDYLATTTLGDLARRAQGNAAAARPIIANASSNNAGSNNSNTGTAAGETASGNANSTAMGTSGFGRANFGSLDQ